MGFAAGAQRIGARGILGGSGLCLSRVVLALKDAAQVLKAMWVTKPRVSSKGRHRLRQAGEPDGPTIPIGQPLNLTGTSQSGGVVNQSRIGIPVLIAKCWDANSPDLQWV